MKKRTLLISTFLAMTVLFSMLFQSLHMYEHVLKQFTQKECQHKYNVTHTEITHQHHNYDTCKVCHFTVGNYITPATFTYKLQVDYKLIPYHHEAIPALITFSGSLYSHRGPPLSLV